MVELIKLYVTFAFLNVVLTSFLGTYLFLKAFQRLYMVRKNKKKDISDDVLEEDEQQMPMYQGNKLDVLCDIYTIIYEIYDNDYTDDKILLLSSLFLYSMCLINELKNVEVIRATLEALNREGRLSHDIFLDNVDDLINIETRIPQLMADIEQKGFGSPPQSFFQIISQVMDEESHSNSIRYHNDSLIRNIEGLVVE